MKVISRLSYLPVTSAVGAVIEGVVLAGGRLRGPRDVLEPGRSEARS